MMRLHLLPEACVRCPFCLAEDAVCHEDSLCEKCGQRVPTEYLQHATKANLTAIQTFGWSGHGKSTFLAGLTMTLARMAMVWRDCTCRALTPGSQLILREVNTFLKTGALPPPTANDGNEALFLIKNAGPWGDQIITYRDYRGEIFDSLDIEIARLPLLSRSPVIFLVLSLNDLREVAAGRSMEMLMENLVSALDREQIDLNRERRRVVVVLTKGDCLTYLPMEVTAYLREDTLWSVLSHSRSDTSEDPTSKRQESGHAPGTDAYRARMERMDQDLKIWIEAEAAGRNLVGIAKQCKLDLRFSVVSATGSQAGENGYLCAPWHPRRVIDPLLWAVDFEARRLSFLDGRLVHRGRHRRVRFES